MMVGFQYCPEQYQIKDLNADFWKETEPFCMKHSLSPVIFYVPDIKKSNVNIQQVDGSRLSLQICPLGDSTLTNDFHSGTLHLQFYKFRILLRTLKFFLYEIPIRFEQFAGVWPFQGKRAQIGKNSSISCFPSVKSKMVVFSRTLINLDLLVPTSL